MGGEIQGRGSAGVVKNDVRTLSDKGTIGGGNEHEATGQNQEIKY
jgi:hypothetical protein